VEEAVSAAEANRQFSRILREVREGKSYLVTSHGAPVARIVPAQRGSATVEAAKEALLSRLQVQPIAILGQGWSRDDLYDR
jgi:prevent-host-death family protein